MRFARLHCEPEAAPLGLDEALQLGELDFLQLDYARPRCAGVDGDAEKLPEAPGGFPQALRSLVRTLYLEPQFRVVASAGWESAYECVERAAGELVAGGCSDLPVAAVRGSNLLPILEMLIADGVDLSNAETGARWTELRRPLLAADLQLGAGPLRTAWAEDARVIVAGSFDGAAPTIAAAVASYGWSWQDLDRVAGAAVAARAAVWCDWPAIELASKESLQQRIGAPRAVEVETTGRALADAVSSDPAAVQRLQDWLRASYAPARGMLRADVQVDAGGIACAATGPQQIAVDGARGKRSDDCWRLEVLYQEGYSVDAMIQFSRSADERLRRRIADAARLHLQAPEDSTGILTMDELHPTGGVDGLAWLRVAYQSRSRKACQLVAERTLRLTSAYRPLVDIAAGSPRVHVLCGLWPARVPRGAVDIAVETRLAREWL